MKYFTTAMFAVFALLFQAPNSHASALPALDDAEQMGFSADSKVDDLDLAGMRGGMRIGNIELNFTISSRTLIDGITQQNTMIQSLNNQLSGHTQKLDPNNPGNMNLNEMSIDLTTQEVISALNSIVQSGEGNNVNIEAVNSANSLLSVIQNSLDNVQIQQFNQLDLTVSNFSETLASSAVQQTMQQMNFGIVNALY